ncbi:MAG TPA: ATP-binding protein [Usitatibacter sp.]|nr:ATP-binding protein [Usitatibacter sp.]
MKVVVVTPNEVDRASSVSIFAEQGLEALACADLLELAPLVANDIGCVVLVEEALVEPEVQAFRECLQSQPSWSDLPILLIAARDSSLSAIVEGVFPDSGNVTVLQRPLHPVSLVSAVKVALRSRRRQVEVRDLLALRDRDVKQRDEFLAMLAHELRNPLAPIRNAVFLMGTLKYSDPLFLKCRAMIEKQSRHVTRMVDDLLDVSRLELGKVELRLQRVDLNESAMAAAESCAPMANAHRHVMNVRPWSEPLTVRADPVRLEQVIGNLIVNAAKFTPDGGTLEVATFLADGQAAVSVTDNGVGIKPEMLDSIFGLFTQESVTLARTQGGLGIGLTLVKRLIELHGGTVRARSEGLGCGARFEVLIPLDAGARASESARPDPSIPCTSKRILVVEDGADTRESLGMLMAAWNHEVIFAANGPDGLNRAREERPDVALIDIGLPGFDGYEVAREIRRDGSPWAREVRLIAVTGYGQEADRARAIDAGFDMHLLKTVDPMKLRELLAT